MSGPAQIVWLRRDLRLADQAAFAAAAAAGPVIPVYILDDETPRHRRMGGASRWWLHHALASLDADLRGRGSRLVLRHGRSDDVLADLCRETGAQAIHALHHYEPWWRNAERAVCAKLPLVLHHGNYLAPPGSVTSGSGKPYRIFTPFWRALHATMPPAAPAPAPQRLIAPDSWPHSDRLEDWRLLPLSPNWAGGFAAEWMAGETAAQARLGDFAPRCMEYAEGRNLPSQELTSRLSPHLHFGEISPAQVWHALTAEGQFPEVFLKELGWRDYAQNVILQFPDYGGQPARENFAGFAWRKGAQARADLAAWQQGRTGYPIVDAGMRQLWTTGWMHNRVRMIAASFLIKHLLIDWREGEKWFWDTLIDADYGSNATNWQWVAGSGVDANMFVRIMAPLSQSEKFNAGDYIRRWVPELAGLGDPYVHDPDDYGCRPDNYPARIIGHREARERALQAWRAG